MIFATSSSLGSADIIIGIAAVGDVTFITGCVRELVVNFSHGELVTSHKALL